MKTNFLIFLFCCSTSFLKAQLKTKIITDKFGVKYNVAESVPEQLKFLLGSYQSPTSIEKIILNGDGTGSITGTDMKFYFECSSNNFIAKAPLSEHSFYAAEQKNYNTLINFVIEFPDSVSEIKLLLNLKTNKAKILNCVKDIASSAISFNAVTAIAYIPLPPKPTDCKAFCDSISIQEKPTDTDKSYFDYGYEARLMELAGADVTKETREACTEKISKFWNKYKTLFRCQSSNFDVEKGSILKFAVVHGFAPFLETIVGTYQMDINFIDIADNLNVLDYVNDRIKKAIKTQGATHPKVNVLKEYKELLEDLGAKSSK